MADIATQSSGHFCESTEEESWQVSNDVHRGKPNDHDERENDEPFAIFSTSWRAGFRKPGDEEKHEERDHSQEKVSDAPAATELPFARATHVLVRLDLGAERLPLASIDLF